MRHLHQCIENMWWSANRPPWLLRAASNLYRIINHTNLEKRASRAITPPVPIISVGNITAGGSGKTPFVMWLAKQLINIGYKPVVICRGDGGKNIAPVLLDPDSNPFEVGDEAVLLFQHCGCPVIAGKDRIRASQMAAELGNIIILDDGFQYRQLQRICDIVLIPSEGTGNGHLIPAGPLREPIAALERADVIVRSGSSNQISALTSGKEWRWWTEEKELVQLCGTKAPTPVKGIALTAIARPQRFISSLKQLNIEIKAHYLFPDHHSYSLTDIDKLIASGIPVIATAKDAVKLQNIWPDSAQLWILHQQAHAEAGLVDAILQFS